MTGGMETTVDSVNTRHTMEHSAVPSSYVQTETAQKLPDYREPPLGFFEGDPGSAPDLQNIPPEHQQQINIDVATGKLFLPKCLVCLCVYASCCWGICGRVV
jgi:hypothetical protein